MSLDVYNGTQWERATAFKRWDGSEWQADALLDRWDGTEWATVWPGRVARVTDYPLSAYRCFSSPSGLKSQAVAALNVGGYTNSNIVSLMWFPVEQIRSDMTGAVVTGVQLGMTRASSNHGTITGYFTVGQSLSGLDPYTQTGNWDLVYTPAMEGDKGIMREQAVLATLYNSVVPALTGGTADCLCLPMHPQYGTQLKGLVIFDSEQTFLRIHYIK